MLELKNEHEKKNQQLNNDKNKNKSKWNDSKVFSMRSKISLSLSFSIVDMQLDVFEIVLAQWLNCDTKRNENSIENIPSKRKWELD